tara:strand:+ start:1053 stop:1628 length:576 start_codon:yes stop_codon:yes gene_type:complete
MDEQLTRLTQLMPPPSTLYYKNVDWEDIEKKIGIKYPTSFKEYIGVYGESVWFDTYSPFYPDSSADDAIEDFLKTTDYYLSFLRETICTEKRSKPFKKEDYIPFPEQGCFFPFMIDYNGSYYYWKTDSADPERWPIIVGPYGHYTIIENTSISKMFTSFIEGCNPMNSFWGDFENLPLELRKVEGGNGETT